MIAEKPDIRLLLDNIRSVHNVGSIFRTAECAGATHIYCTETTPTPVDRFGRKRKDFAKVALGAEDMLKWEHVHDAAQHIRKLKKEGFRIIAIEQSKKAVDYRLLKPGKKTLIVLGSEVDGVSTPLLMLADEIGEIPLYGEKESLNVSVAAGIALYGIINAVRIG